MVCTASYMNAMVQAEAIAKSVLIPFQLEINFMKSRMLLLQPTLNSHEGKETNSQTIKQINKRRFHIQNDVDVLVASKWMRS